MRCPRPAEERSSATRRSGLSKRQQAHVAHRCDLAQSQRSARIAVWQPRIILSAESSSGIVKHEES